MAGFESVALPAGLTSKRAQVAAAEAGDKKCAFVQRYALVIMLWVEAGLGFRVARIKFSEF